MSLIRQSKDRMLALFNRLAANENLRLREWQRSALLFAAVIIVAFPQVVFLGRSFVPSDNYNPLDARLGINNYGSNYISGEAWTKPGLEFCANVHDPGGAWWVGEPGHHFFRHAILSGEFPFWDPHAGCGVPAYTNPISEFLFPPQIALSLAGATSLQKNVYILLLFWASGYATYWFLRFHGLSAIPSFAGGVAFLFSGANQQIGPSIFSGQIIACMPLLLLATKWFVNLPTWRRTACLALIYATVSVASFPPFLVAGFGFAVLYLVCAVLIDCQGNRLLLLRRYVTAIVLSVACVAGYYLPTFLTIAYTNYTTEWYRSAGLEIMPFRAVFELLSPVIAATEARVYTNPVLKLSVLGHFYYVGATVLLLALMAGGKRAVAQSRPLVFCCVSGIALILLKMFGVPPVQWIAFLPGFQSVHYTLYFGTIVALALCLLAAVGLQRLQDREASARMFALTVGIMTVGFLALWHQASKSGGLQREGAWRWIADYRLLLAVAGGASCLIMATMTRRIVLTSALARSLLLALVGVEGVINATYPRQNRWDVFEHPPKYVSVMQRLQKPARAFVGGALTANLGSAFGIDEFDSLYMFSAPRMYALYERYAVSASAITMRDATAIPPDLVLDRAAINYLLIRYEIPSLFNVAASRGYATEYDDGYVRLFRRGAAPRYLFSSDYVVTGSFKALDLIATSPAKQIVLETAPGFEASPNQADDPETQLTSTKLNSLTLSVRAPRAGLLYLAEAWYPGWRATVNGKPTAILKANYGFRAVVVPAGEVIVKLWYLPVGFLPGVTLSAIGFIAVVMLLWFGERDVRKRAEASYR